MGSIYPNLSWFPKPSDWPDDFDGAVIAQTDDGAYAIRPISPRPAGSTRASWWDQQVFVATIEPRNGDTLTLTPGPIRRLEAHSAVKAHQRQTIDEREKPKE
jgi:hypothetical protein